MLVLMEEYGILLQFYKGNSLSRANDRMVPSRRILIYFLSMRVRLAYCDPAGMDSSLFVEWSKSFIEEIVELL